MSKSITEFVVSEDGNVTAVEVHSVVRDGAATSRAWLTPQLWKDILAAAAPVLKEGITGVDVMNAVLTSPASGVTALTVPQMRAICAFRPWPHPSLRVSNRHPVTCAKMRICSKKLVVAVAPASDESDETTKMMYAAVGEQYRADTSIAKYFAKSKS